MTATLERERTRAGFVPGARIAWTDGGGMDQTGTIIATDDAYILPKWDSGGSQIRIGWSTPDLRVIEASDEPPELAAPYQLLPDLTADEYDALKADIALRGVLVPVEYDEEGNILDGHHRARACEELGKDFPRTIRSGMSEAEKRQHVRALNLNRRHLTQAQRRDLIADQLRETPERSNRSVAADLGVSHPTVATVREELEATGKIYQLDRTIGADGKERPASRPPAPPEEPAHPPPPDDFTPTPEELAAQEADVADFAPVDTAPETEQERPQLSVVRGGSAPQRPTLREATVQTLPDRPSRPPAFARSPDEVAADGLIEDGIEAQCVYVSETLLTMKRLPIIAGEDFRRYIQGDHLARVLAAIPRVRETLAQIEGGQK